MKFSFFKIFTLFFCLLPLCSYAEGEVRDNSTGVTFPGEVSFDHEGKQYHLLATGVSTRKKFFIKVYSIASYLQEGTSQSSDKFQEIMRDDKAKQLTMKWVHNATVDQVQNGYQDSFRKVLSDSQRSQLQNEINTFVYFFNQEAKKGDEHILRWLPGGYVEVIINGNKVGDITDQDFAKGLWMIWFGSKSVVDRDNLVSLMK